MYAVIETGGKQYNVKVGDKIRVEKLQVSAGDSYTFENVLFVSNEDNVQVGMPFVQGANVSASVIRQDKEKKIYAYKYKPKKGYHRKIGHRQPFTMLKIDAINA